LRFLTGPTLIFSVTVVAGLLVASPDGTNCPVRASLTLVEVLLILNGFKFNNVTSRTLCSTLL